MNKIDNKFIILLLRIEYENGTFATIGNMQKVNSNDLSKLLLVFKNVLSLKSNDYQSNIIKNIIFSYKIIPNNNLVTKKSKLSKIKDNNHSSYKFFGWDLPKTMDYKLFGRVVLNYDNSKLVLIKSFDENYFYKVYIKDSFNEVHILNTDHTLIVKFYDYIIDKNDLSTFTRIISHQTYHFKNGELLVKKLDRKTSFLKSINIDKKN